MAEFGKFFDSWEKIEKAVKGFQSSDHKYIRRYPKTTGEGWYYVYRETFMKPFNALRDIFNLKKERIEQDYEKNNIKKDYGVDKNTFAAHILEYFVNKDKWNKLFARKEVRAKYNKPQKQEDLIARANDNLGGEKKQKTQSKNKIINRSLMKKIYTIYNPQAAQTEKNEKDNKNIEKLEKKQLKSEAEKHANRSNAMRGNKNAEKNTIEEKQDGSSNNRIVGDGLSSSTGDIRSGEIEEYRNPDVFETGVESNSDEFIQQPREFGERFGEREVATGSASNGRLTKGQTRKIRQECLDLLANKSDAEMTEEDKSLLRQYEGAGGTGEKGQSNEAVLSEFYTPRDVISKVWEIVDKYNSNPNKKVIEPSGGIGRFLEDRTEDFTLCEIDPNSSRIAGILHPNAEIKQGAFQKLFMQNNAVIKNYNGEKYDVAVGNPPYAKYSGEYKGLGEGKNHTRYEEYFMDRTLDTLKDGGIMAFVVPSSFLRSGNSKAKEIIAKKGKLLEAWRLPKGTFSSTDVGTDIVVIRKEEGNIDDFNNNGYFTENETHVIGYETEASDRFGKPMKVINLPEGKTIDEAIQMIDVNAVAVENAYKMEVARTEAIEENQPLKKRYKVNGNLIKGSKITTKGGKKGVIVRVENDAITFKMDNGDFGRCSKSDIDVYADKKTEQEISEALSEAMKGNQNAKKDFHKEVKKKAKKGDVFQPSLGKNQTAEEFNKKYCSNIPSEDIKFWKAVDWNGNVDTTKLSNDELKELKNSQSFIKDYNGDYTSIVKFASGNIYKKIDELEANKNNIDENEYKIMKDILESAKPALKTINEFSISPISNIADAFKLENGKTLKEAFLKYAGFTYDRWGWGYSSYDSAIAQSELEEGMSMQDIRDYILQKPVRAERARSEEDKRANKLAADEKKKNRRNVTERLFNEWLKQLPESEKNKLEKEWNKIYNAVAKVDYSKYPIFVEGMNTYKGKKEFNMTEQQVKGISELCQKGTGVLAYDVGVGKTVTGLVATVNQMQTGKSKRPLICVPKAVYKKWIKETKQHFPDIKINELNNFGKDIEKFKDADGKVVLPENAINICTYEALNKITFKEETMQGDLLDDFMDIQSIEDYDENGVLIPDNRSEREKADNEQKIRKQLGMSAKVSLKDGEQPIYWEDLGIDHITVDELHNFKNVFSIPRAFKGSFRNGESEEEQVANEFAGIAGATSGRAMKLFAISQLIQRENDGRGFFGLSATPFNNSPVEIYNIISLVARKRLKDLKIYNLTDFLKQFAEMQQDWKVMADGSVQAAQVMKNFKNLGALQNLITEFIDKVDGEEAGVIRPFKRVHTPSLTMNKQQQFIMAVEQLRMSGMLEAITGIKTDVEDDGANTLIAMNNMRMATLSPALIDPKYMDQYNILSGSPALNGMTFKEPSKREVVTSSPKLQFVCDCTVKQYKDRPKEGQVIYMPRGVEQFPYVKDYLVAQGMPEDSIAFMDSKTSIENKEKIKEDFNDPDGKIKVIIGSETIKEGVSLNGNSSTIYNTMLGWNPTETTQVEGRIWRQGNKQGATHIVYPLMYDTIDAMMYQKYDEKSSRLNALWSYKGESLNVEDINPEELKFELIRDPHKRAEMKINKVQKENQRQMRLLNIRYDKISQSQRDLRNSERVVSQYTDIVTQQENEYNEKREQYQEQKKKSDALAKKVKKTPDDRSLVTEYQNESWRTDNLKRRLDSQKQTLQQYKNIVKEAKDKIESNTTYLYKNGIDDIDNVENKLNEISQQREDLKNAMHELRDRRGEIEAEEVRKNEEKEKNAKSTSVEENVKELTSSIANDLRPFAGVKSSFETMKNYTTKQIQDVIDTIKKDGKAKVGDGFFDERDIKDVEKFKGNLHLHKSIVISRNGRILFRKNNL